MNIVQIIPGSGGSFYCGNCLRDSKFVNALRSTGHEITIIPMYLPLFAHENIGEIPVFYGAISTYLRQNYTLFRNAPRWIDKILNSKPMLKLAASKAGSTRAEGLEDMTISMLLGLDGKQKHELEHLINWLKDHCKPDVVHISNALLLGMAGPIKQALNVPIVCSLQDEDVWVDGMSLSFQSKVWGLMSEKANDVDHFISVSDYFAGVSKERMKIPESKISTVHLGVDPDDYHFQTVSNKPLNIGFISRMCEENGLDILVDAFIKLKENKNLSSTKLIITGGSTGDDKKYIQSVKQKIDKATLDMHVEFQEEFNGEARNEFFRKVAVISVPVRKGEAFGIYLTEALASGVAIVQPALGAFPEIVKISGGGELYEPNIPEMLANTLEGLLTDTKKLGEYSKNGRQSITNKFNVHKLAQKIIGVYENVKNTYSNVVEP